MNRHFDYLIEDDSRAFFQKVAEDYAGAPARARQPPAPTGRTALAETPLGKLASEIAADLIILKSAGAVGCNLGMTKRALAHLGRLAEDPRVLSQPGVVPDLFNKVAATALEADLDAATAELCALAPEPEHAGVRAELAKIALALTVGLDSVRRQLAKEAAGLGISGLGRAARIGESLRGAENAARGVVGAAEGGLSRVGREWRARQALNARAGARQVGKEIEGTRAAGQALEANRGQMKPSQFTKSVGENKAVAAGQAQQFAKAQSAYAGRRAAAVAKSPAAAAVHAPVSPAPKSTAAPAPSASSATAPSATVPSTTSTTAGPKMSPARAQAEAQFGKITKGKPQSESGPSTSEATDKAKAAATPQSTPSASGGETHEEGEGGQGEGAGKLTDTFHKFHSKGWGSLSGAEKQQLMTTGAGAIGAHRLLSGRDLLTGDKND